MIATLVREDDVENSDPTPLMSDVLALLRESHDFRRLSDQKKTFIENAYREACEECREQFDQHEKKNARPNDAQIIAESLAFLVAILHNKFILEYAENFDGIRFSIVISITKSFEEIDGTEKIWHSRKNSGTVPLLTDGKTFLVPTADVFHASHCALSSQKEWQAPSNEFPFRDFGPLQFSLGNFTNTGKFNAESNSGFSSDIERFEPDTALIYKYATGAWLRAYADGTLDKLQAVTLHMNALCEAKGLKRTNNRDFTPEQKRDVLEKLLVAARVHLQGETPLPNGKTQKIHGTLLEVISRGDKDNGIFTPYEVTIIPGLAVRKFFIENPQIGHFFSAIFKLKTNRPGVDRIAAMIGTYLAQQFTIRRSHGNYDQPFFLGKLLESSMIDLPTDPRLYSRFMESIEGDNGAFERLKGIGVIKDWQYKAGDYENLPDRGKFDPWLRCRTIFTPPNFILEESNKFQSKRGEHIKKAIANSRKKTVTKRKSKP
jgi:hypothetical protein